MSRHGASPVHHGSYVTLAVDGCPDLAAIHSANPSRYPCLLESTVRGTPRSRYDILFGFPEVVISSRDGNARGAFLNQLAEAWTKNRIPPRPGTADIPFIGGWCLYVGYELAAEIEPVRERPRDELEFPKAIALRVPAAVVRDHDRQETVLVVEAGRESLLHQMVDDVRTVSHPEPTPLIVEAYQEDDPDEFLRGVKRVKDYIAAGDVFQVNLSRAWRIALKERIPPAEVYRRLCRANPAPFAALMVLPGNQAIICSSPERLVCVDGHHVSTRPIAGTYPRGQDASTDVKLATELLRHPKERAEHVMLIDLERNDLGRVCRAGTVTVNEMMTVESYRHVHHIVSEVSGELRDGVSPIDVIRATFPGGTITGCPKVRCMQIIREIETDSRRAYTGSLGYLGRDGRMDLNILIRTIVQNKNHLVLRAGAGIVADSVPDRELAETRAKAQGMLRALGLNS